MKRHTVSSALVLLCLLSMFQRTLRAAENIAEWHLPEGAIARLGKGPVNQIAYSPDGNHLAVLSDIGVWIYDASTGTEQALLTRDTGRAVSNVGFSPDGQTLAVTGDRQELQLWDTRTWTLNGTLDKDGNWPTDFAFSPDGNTIATGMDENRVMLWDTRTEEPLYTFKHFSEYDSTVHGVAFSPDGSTLATANISKILLSDTSTWTLKHTYEIDACYLYYDDISIALMYSPDGKTLAHGCNGTVLWDSLTGTLKNRLAGHAGTVTSVTYHPDGNILATAGQDGTVLLWDLTSHHLNPPKEE